jgi:hypothetical protein
MRLFLWTPRYCYHPHQHSSRTSVQQAVCLHRTRSANHKQDRPASMIEVNERIEVASPL